MADLANDVRFGWRTLRRNPAFAAVAVLTLACGIGANVAIFSFIDGALLKPLPYPDADRIVRVLQKLPNGPFPVSTLDFLAWQRDSTVFEFLAAERTVRMTLSGNREPVLLNGARVSPRYFDISGIQPILGRTFHPEEDQPGADRVLVLSHRLWINEFGADRTVIGRQVIVDNEAHTIVGVMPAGTTFDRSFAQLWKPLAFAPFEQTRGLHWLQAYARLKPGVSRDQAQQQMDSLAARYAEQYPDNNSNFGVSIERLSDILVGLRLRVQLYVLFAASAMVLLIGCSNLANLALTRGLSRAREVAVRAALGASRWQLVRQLLVEHVMLAISGGLLSIGLGYAMMRWLSARMPPLTLPPDADLRFDERVLLFAMAVSVLTGVLFGLAPALRVTRPDLAGTMKDGGRGSTSGAAHSRLRGALVVAEVALAFVLLTGAGLLIRSFFNLTDVEAAAAPSSRVLTMILPTPTLQYTDDLPRLRQYLRDIERVVAVVPGVEVAAVTSGVPLRGTGYNIPMLRADAEPILRPRRPVIWLKSATPSYFAAVGMQLRAGRLLDDSDADGARPVAVVNERLARQMFPDVNPIGQRILVPRTLPGKPTLGEDIAREIVGIVSNERIATLDDQASAVVYVTMEQSPYLNPSLVVRAAADPAALVASIRRAVDTVNKEQPLSDIRTLEQIKVESLTSNRLQTTVISVFSTLALVLAALGIYGVLAYSVTQRIGEMAVRAAMGATRRHLLWLVLGNGMTLTIIGLAIGLAAAFGVTRGLSTLLFGVGTLDPVIMTSAAATLVGVAVLACLIPARKATTVDVVTLLR